MRATISEMGPLLLSRLLGLNETQEGVLNIAFRLADENGWLLLDLKDLRAMLTHIADNAGALTTTYGNVSAASVGAIQRRLLTLEGQGAERLFGEPALNIADLMQTDAKGQGYVNVLAADKLVHTPAIYSTFLLWLLSELFEALPEAGDLDKPKLVFFFDEAHLLFDEAPKVLLDKVEQVVRLIRSKGVGVYFVTQNPLDVPDTVLGQLGNRVQHALRAFTPRDQKAVRAAAETFRPNPKLDTERVITELGVGEALASVLDAQGTPTVVQRIFVAPPGSKLGPIEPAERAKLMEASLVKGVYEAAVDRVSAYEVLKQRAEFAAVEAAAAPSRQGPTQGRTRQPGSVPGGGLRLQRHAVPGDPDRPRPGAWDHGVPQRRAGALSFGPEEGRGALEWARSHPQGPERLWPRLLCGWVVRAPRRAVMRSLQSRRLAGPRVMPGRRGPGPSCARRWHRPRRVGWGSGVLPGAARRRGHPRPGPRSRRGSCLRTAPPGGRRRP